METNEQKPTTELASISTIVSTMVDHLKTSQDHFTTLTNTLVENQNRVLEQQNRERFWRNVRTGFLVVSMIAVPVIYATALSNIFAPAELREGYVAMVRVDGTIGPDERSNAIKVNNALDKAFEDKDAKGVVVLINSPGGSPVQSSVIRERIKQLRGEYPDKKVWAVGEDMMTSGAYYVATGADQICVNPATMTGSIGVITESFGLQKIADKFGVERRIYTAGTNKHRMDAFKPVLPADEAKLHSILNAVHMQFIAAVKDGRGDRLVKDRDAELFSGDYWTGDEAVTLGLADSLCDLPSLLQKEYHVKAVKDYTLPASIFTGLATSFGASVKEQLVESRGPQFLPSY